MQISLAAKAKIIILILDFSKATEVILQGSWMWQGVQCTMLVPQCLEQIRLVLFDSFCENRIQHELREHETRKHFLLSGLCSIQHDYACVNSFLKSWPCAIYYLTLVTNVYTDIVQCSFKFLRRMLPLFSIQASSFTFMSHGGQTL